MDLPGRAVVLEAAALGLLDAVGVPVPRRVGERRRGRVRDRLPPLDGPRLLEGPPQRALELLLLVLRRRRLDVSAADESMARARLVR